MHFITSLVGRLAHFYPWELTASDELADSLSFIESSLEPETVVEAGYGAGFLSLLVPIGLSVLPIPFVALVLFAGCFSIGVIHAVHATPHLLAALRRTEALGDAPNLVGRIVLRMQIQPSLESATRFAADTGTGPLAANLSAHIDRSIGTPETGLLSFTDEWSEEFPALKRSAHMLATAQESPPAERPRTLDRALGAILDGTRNQMADFTSAIRGPTTGLFAFGVMLPLALVALVPAIPMAGFSVSIWLFVALYNVVLPTILLVATGWLLVRRPVAFPPPKIDRTHPDVPDRLWVRSLWGLLFGVLAYGLAVVGDLGALAPIIAGGVGVGTALLALFHPIVAVRTNVRNVEANLTDALYLVGRHVAEGESVESAIALAGERIPAETGSVFETAAGVQRRLHVGVEAAFLGEYGALGDVPSSRVRGTAALLAIASAEGRPAGRAIVAMADHLEELAEVEREAKRQLSSVTDTLDSTTAYFGPLVAGATVALAGMMTGDLVFVADATAFPTEDLGIVVGVYVVTLCCILIPLSIALRFGFDRALVGYSVGKSLVSAMVLYGFTIFLVGFIG